MQVHTTATYILYVSLWPVVVVPAKIIPETCPAYRLDQHERVVKGKSVDTSIDLPADLLTVVWHSPNISCLGQHYYEFSRCQTSGQSSGCSMDIAGYQALLLDADDPRNNGNVWTSLLEGSQGTGSVALDLSFGPVGWSPRNFSGVQRGRNPQLSLRGSRSINMVPSGATGKRVETAREKDKAPGLEALALSTAQNPQNSSRQSSGFRLHLQVEAAKRRFESLGSSITYSTTSGKRVTRRVFRPQMVYTPLRSAEYTCRNVALAGVNYTYFELIVKEVSPLMECEHFDRPEIRFSYTYKPMDSDDGTHNQDGNCICLIPRVDIQTETQRFRVRAKTRGIRSVQIYQTRVGRADRSGSAHGVTRDWGDVATVARETAEQFQETVKVLGQKVPIAPPGEEFITYVDADVEPDPWHEVVVNTSECDEQKRIAVNDIDAVKGLITLDQNSCPVFMADGQVSNCRCHVTDFGLSKYPGLRVAWSNLTVDGRFMTHGNQESTVIAHAYNGTTRSYDCEALDAWDFPMETVVYCPLPIAHKMNEYTLIARQKLWVLLIAAITNLGVFIAQCLYTSAKKNSLRYREDIVNLSVPKTLRELKNIALAVEKIERESIEPKDLDCCENLKQGDPQTRRSFKQGDLEHGGSLKQRNTHFSTYI